MARKGKPEFDLGNLPEEFDKVFQSITAEFRESDKSILEIHGMFKSINTYVELIEKDVEKIERTLDKHALKEAKYAKYDDKIGTLEKNSACGARSHRTGPDTGTPRQYHLHSI